MWQTDDNKANFQLNPHAPTQKMQQMELDWGFGNYTGDRPAGRGGRHHPHPPVALQHVRGQRPQGPELVQEREGERLLRPADRVRQLPERLGLGAGPGGHRRDRPGLRDLDPAPAHERLHRARRRRHALQPQDRRGPRLRVGQAGPEDQPAGDQEAAGRVGDARLHALGAGGRGHPGHRGRGVRRVPARPGLRGGQDRYRRGRGQERDLGVRLLRALQAIRSSWSSSCCPTPVTAPTPPRPPSGRSRTASTASRATRRPCRAGSCRPCPGPGRRR